MCLIKSGLQLHETQLFNKTHLQLKIVLKSCLFHWTPSVFVHSMWMLFSLRKKMSDKKAISKPPNNIKKIRDSPVSVCLWRRVSVEGSSCSMWHLGSSGPHSRCVSWSPSLTNHTQQQTLTARNTILHNKWVVHFSFTTQVIKLDKTPRYEHFSCLRYFMLTKRCTSKSDQPF